MWQVARSDCGIKEKMNLYQVSFPGIFRHSHEHVIYKMGSYTSNKQATDTLFWKLSPIPRVQRGMQRVGVGIVIIPTRYLLSSAFMVRQKCAPDRRLLCNSPEVRVWLIGWPGVTGSRRTGFEDCLYLTVLNWDLNKQKNTCVHLFLIFDIIGYKVVSVALWLPLKQKWFCVFHPKLGERWAFILWWPCSGHSGSTF